MKHPGKAFAIGLMMVFLLSLVSLLAFAMQEAKTLNGVVKAVDIENQTLQITENTTNQEYVLKVESTAAITKGDETITLAEIKAGDKVTIVLEQGKVKSVKVM